MSLTFKRIDEIFKEYGLESYMAYGERTEYAFPDRESMTRKKSFGHYWKELSNIIHKMHTEKKR